VTGTVPVTAGSVVVDGGEPSAITGSFDLSAIDTGNTRRDKHLRSPKFLGLDRYPTMTFTTDTISATPRGWLFTGYLTVRNVSVRLTSEAEVMELDRSAAVTVHARLDRRNLGIRAPRILIGHTISITVTATLRLADSQ
jgi:polyisoprenoid-binding protein YceI